MKIRIGYFLGGIGTWRDENVNTFTIYDLRFREEARLWLAGKKTARRIAPTGGSNYEKCRGTTPNARHLTLNPCLCQVFFAKSPTSVSRGGADLRANALESAFAYVRFTIFDLRFTI